jgi:hypothetical protein
VLKLTRSEQQQVDTLTQTGLPVLAWRPQHMLQTVVLQASTTPYLVGRAASATIRLPHATVSASHAVLDVPSPLDVYVTDKDSLNGTFVNGVRLRRRARLKDGAVLRLGAEWLLVRVVKGSQATVPVFAGGTLEDLSPRRFEVLWWLCEPMTQRDQAEPARRDDLCVGLEVAASTLGEHLQRAAETLGVPAGEGMRLRLAQRAMQLGIGSWPMPVRTGIGTGRRTRGRE